MTSAVQPIGEEERERIQFSSRLSKLDSTCVQVFKFAWNPACWG